MPDPTQEALVDVGLSSIREPLHVATYGDGAEADCIAFLELPLAKLPSRRLVPRPRELAGELAPVMEIFGTKTCSITVWVSDGVGPAADPETDEEVCQRGTFRYDGGSWSTAEDDAPCW